MFLGVDPLADFYPGWTPYHYVHNNPLRYTDPTGMSADDIIYRDEKTGQEVYREIQDGDDIYIDVAVASADGRANNYSGVSQPRSSSSSGINLSRSFGHAYNVMSWLTNETASGIDENVFDGAGQNIISGDYSQAALGIVLSRVKILPNVTNRKLKNIVDDLFRDIPDHKKIGNGSAMDAFRHELKTGEAVGGKFHKEKLENVQRGLQNLLENQRSTLGDYDTKVTKALLKDIGNELSGK